MEKELVQVATFTYPHEAHMAMGYLESYEIEVHIKDELTVQTYNFLSNAVGGVKLLVYSNVYDEALQLLVKGGFIFEPKEDEEPEPKMERFDEKYKHLCPYCGDDNVAMQKKASYLFVISILLLGFPLLFMKKEYYCYNCGKLWRIK